MNLFRILVKSGLVGLILVGCVGSPVEEPLPPLEPTEAATAVPTAVPPTPTPAATAAPICTPFNSQAVDADAQFWWNDRVFYEVFVRSFYDSDGDGIGDFNGLIERLDYLNDGDPNTTDDLGITGLWLMPINASPSYHGYDVTDFMAVNEEYGTMDDFRRLLDEAHQRGIRVIIDLVLNHTSTKHPWFQAAAEDPDSLYRDYYIWEESPPGFKSPWGSDVWHPGDTGYYYGIFWGGMPDLNYTNPEVTAEAQEVIRFWLEDVGVDGFRLDAIKHLIEEGADQENTTATHAWWEGFYDYYTEINPDAFTVGEAWTETEEVVRYIGDEVNIAFEFDHARAMLTATRRKTKIPVLESHELITESYPLNQFATFLTNHDQGRVATEFLRDTDQIKTAASLLLTGPGVPFLYYGEEIGQSGSKPDENIRTPMQWSSETHAGFTSAEIPWRLPQKDYPEVNVEVETGEPDSVLSHYRRLIQARNQNEALRVGGWLELPADEDNLYSFLRYTDNQVLLVLINLGDDSIEDYRFCLNEGPFEAGTAREILQDAPVLSPTLNSGGGFDAYRPIEVLEPYSVYIVEME